MKLLITGGAGFIGSNFVHLILQETSDVEMVVLDALTYAGNLESLEMWNNDPRFRFVKGGITDRALLDTLFPEIDAVVHFAAESHVDRSILGPKTFIETNVMGTFELLEAARRNGGTRFHHVSTDEVFGSLTSDAPAFTEMTPYDPRSPYSASKASSDHLVRAYAHTYKLPVTISNTSNNYGPFAFPEKFIPLVITNLLEGKKIPLYGDGLQVRDWVHVEDHIRGIWSILQNGKIRDTYCLGGGNERTNLSVVKSILAILGKDENMIEYVKDRPGHDVRYAIDYSKAKRELGWEPQISFEDGLKKTVAWYQEHEAWWKRVKSGEYQEFYVKQYGK